MLQDEIIEEIHRIREEYAKSFNYDLDAIFADLQKQQAESGRKIVNLSSHLPSNDKTAITVTGKVDHGTLAQNIDQDLYG